MASAENTGLPFAFTTPMHKICYRLNYIGIIALTGMMLITALDVILRYCFRAPLTGSNEVTEFLLLISVMTGVAYAAAENRHIGIDAITANLPQKGQDMAAALSNGLLLLLFTGMAWKMISYTFFVKEMGRTSAVLMLPNWPFVLIMAIGFGLVALCTLANLLDSLRPLLKSPVRFIIWLVVVVVVAYVGWQIISQGRSFPIRLEPLTAGIIGLVVLFAFMMLGFPVMAALAVTGLVGICYLRGTNAGLLTLGASPFDTLTNYTFTTIPLFILMGEFCYFSGIGGDLYNMAYRWVGHWRGGLAIGTVAACGGFAAVCGDSMATAVTMGTVAIPEMRKYNYKPSLAAGVVAAGGTLGVLIPPSLAFILYALLADQSISTLFVAGILPGVVLVLLFMGIVRLQIIIDPRCAPAGPRSTWKERFAALRGVWAVIVLFIFVIGGMYKGLFTPMEGAGMGAFGTLVVCLCRRRLSWRGFINSLLETSKVTAVCVSILIGANIFGVFLTTSKVPMVLAQTVVSMQVPPIVTLLVILIVYLIMGCIMPAIPMLILTVPIFFPVVQALGFDPVWYGVLMVIMFEMAVITPPMGINVLALRSIVRDCPVMDMFKGTLPFLGAMVVLIALLIFIPDIALLLPRLLGAPGM